MRWTSRNVRFLFWKLFVILFLLLLTLRWAFQLTDFTSKRGLINKWDPVIFHQQISLLDAVEDDRSVILINRTRYIRQLHLCQSDFQKSVELIAFNRTMIVYEIEWLSKKKINILSVIVESPQYPLEFVGDLTVHLNKIYSVQCVYNTFTRQGQFRYFNMHDYDRTILIECDDMEEIDENHDSTLRLQLTELATKKIIAMNLNLCWSLDRRVNIGHCHKALFEDVPFYLIEQWLTYHIFIGIEQFHIYDRTLKYKEYLQPFIDQGYVIYIPFPLAKQYADRERFNWIDQFVGKMHCLMHIRSAFDWLGTWDIDEYLNFHTDESHIFLPQCHRDERCTSMLSEYLKENFQNYKNIIIYAANFMGKRSLTVDSRISNGSGPIIIEQYQHRLRKWNDRVKYLVQPKHTDMINIHYALYITNNRTYESFMPSPEHVTADNPRSLLRLNHYPSSQIVRDDLLLAYHTGTVEYYRDTLLWDIFWRLNTMNSNQNLMRLTNKNQK